jgi:hypothetical protein
VAAVTTGGGAPILPDRPCATSTCGWCSPSDELAEAVQGGGTCPRRDRELGCLPASARSPTAEAIRLHTTWGDAPVACRVVDSGGIGGGQRVVPPGAHRVRRDAHWPAPTARPLGAARFAGPSRAWGVSSRGCAALLPRSLTGGLTERRLVRATGVAPVSSGTAACARVGGLSGGVMPARIALRCGL